MSTRPEMCPNCNKLVRIDWLDRCGSCGLPWSTVQVIGPANPAAQAKHESATTTAVVASIALALVVAVFGTGATVMMKAAGKTSATEQEVAKSYSVDGKGAAPAAATPAAANAAPTTTSPASKGANSAPSISSAASGGKITISGTATFSAEQAVPSTGPTTMTIPGCGGTITVADGFAFPAQDSDVNGQTYGVQGAGSANSIATCYTKGKPTDLNNGLLSVKAGEGSAFGLAESDAILGSHKGRPYVEAKATLLAPSVIRGFFVGDDKYLILFYFGDGDPTPFFNSYQP